MTLEQNCGLRSKELARVGRWVLGDELGDGSEGSSRSVGGGGSDLLGSCVNGSGTPFEVPSFDRRLS